MRNDVQVRKGGKALLARIKTRMYERVAAADQWRRDALRAIREAVKVGDMAAIDKAALALRVYGGQRHEVGFTTSDLEYHVNKTCSFLYEGWVGKDGKEHEGLARVIERKLKQRRQANQDLSKGKKVNKFGMDLREWRDKLTHDLQDLEARVKKEEAYAQVLQDELERRG